ncbi:MAG: hydrogenase 4 subunit B [Nitrospirota bacterium]
MIFAPELLASPTPIFLATLAVSLWLAGTLLVPVLARRPVWLIRSAFSLATLGSALAAVGGAWAVAAAGNEAIVLPIGIPELPFHLRLDPLAGFFLVVIGAMGFFTSIYSLGYVRGIAERRPVGGLVLFFLLFLAGMGLVVLADDAFLFLVAWEGMTVSSYFLVVFEHEQTANQKAGFLYLLMAHVGAITILLAFGVMAAFATGLTSFEGYAFDAMRRADIAPGWATAAFLLALFGFGLKAGIVPLHVWLPEAHPVAPSNVSALMSGVMIKMAIYGIIRVTFDLLAAIPWWWGALVLALGLVSALMGVLYALMQHDLKRLLAYHSVENIGIILIGIGLGMTFHAFDLPELAALGLIAGLYHTLNHALFKGLLFLGAGAVQHATHTREMEALGGLIHRMPWTAALFLVGCISISALPPFNGFVSEWLTYQAFLLSPSLPSTLLNILVPIGAAGLALTSALAAACFVKAFGITFLGQPRSRHAQNVSEVGITMRIGMAGLALACLLLGILPATLIDWLDVIPRQFVGAGIAESASSHGWLWLTPIAPERASYSGTIVFLGIGAIIGLTWFALHGRRHRAPRRGPAWDCGFEKMTPRMQYTATSFSMPIRVFFGALFKIRERSSPMHVHRHAAFPERVSYSLHVDDRFWGWIYKPVSDAAFWIARLTTRIQGGRIQVYLIYSFLTILVLLIFGR